MAECREPRIISRETFHARRGLLVPQRIVKVREGSSRKRGAILMFWILDKVLKFFKPPRPEVNERLKQKLEQQRKNRETRPEVEPQPNYSNGENS
jgi:hypothetical protein